MFTEKFKRTLTALLSGASLGLSPTPGDETSVFNSPIRDKWALVIGVRHFATPNIDLKYADKDAKDFRDFLVNKAHFAPDHVQLLLNEDATRLRILDYLGDKWLPAVTLPDDLVVIYISSHGSPSSLDVAGANFLVAHDTDPQHLFATGISMKELASIVKERIHCERVVIVLDACHSGATKTETGNLRRSNFDAKNVMQGTRQVVVCSSKPSEVSWESARYQNGVFTRQLIETFSAPVSKPTLGTSFNDLAQRVRAEVLKDRGSVQTPVLESNEGGKEIDLLATPARPRSAPNIALDEPKPKPPTTKQYVPPNVVCLQKLATSKMEQRQFDEALILYENLRTLLELTVGRDSVETVDCLTQLGWLYAWKGRTADAESLQRESVRVNETLYGPNSFFVAREVTLLCNTLLQRKDYTEAEPVALRALAAWEGYGGKDHDYSLESLVNLGEIRQHQGQYQEAKELYDRASILCARQRLEPNNPHRIKLETHIRSLQERNSSRHRS